MASPLISIIVGAYNCERFLEATLLSIQAQTVEDWECVLVNDGSTDGTLEIAEYFATRDSRIRVKTVPNAGCAAARNEGYASSNPKSTYVSFMDADDLWIPESLETLVRGIEPFPCAIGVYGSGECINENGEAHHDPDYERVKKGRVVYDKWGKLRILGPKEPTTFRSLWFSNPYPPGVVLARRSAYEKAGPFDVTLGAFDDLDMLLRLSRRGVFHFVDQVILSYRRHSRNVSARSAKRNLTRLRALQHKTFFSPENNAEHRRILRENWQATQFFHWRQKWSIGAKYLSEAHYLEAGREFAGSCVQVWRLVRGCPARQGI